MGKDGLSKMYDLGFRLRAWDWDIDWNIIVLVNG